MDVAKNRVYLDFIVRSRPPTVARENEGKAFTGERPVLTRELVYILGNLPNTVFGYEAIRTDYQREASTSQTARSSPGLPLFLLDLCYFGTMQRNSSRFFDPALN